MRSEKRTFQREAFQRWLSVAQILCMIVGAALWGFVRNYHFLGELTTAQFAWKFLALGISSWICISCMQLVRYLLFKRQPDVPDGGARIGFLWGKGGMVSCKCLAAIHKTKYMSILLLSMLPWPILWILGLVFGCFSMFLIGWLGFASILGDIASMCRLISVPKGSWVQDSPFEPGCEVYLHGRDGGEKQ